MSKDILHELIHSLSAFEKGYYIKSKEDSHLTTLFNAMNKLETYSKTGLEKLLSKHPELLKHLAKYKNNSYSDIMRVMRSYRQEKKPSVEIRLRTHLTDVSFLTERNLVKSAMKLIKEAKKLAMEYEKYGIVLDILRYEIKLAQLVYDKTLIDVVHSLIEEEKQVLSILQDEQRYNEITSLMSLSFAQNTTSNNQDQIQYFNELIQDKLLVNKEHAISFVSQYQYYQIHSWYNFLLNNFQESFAFQKMGLEVWDAHPHQKQEHIQTYAIQVCNYLSLCSRIRNYTTFEEVSNKLKKEIKSTTPHNRDTIFERICLIDLCHYFVIADFDKIEELSIDVQQHLKKNSKNMNGLVVGLFQMLLNSNLFLTSRYEKAYDKCSDFLKQKLPIQVDYQRFAWAVKLMIAYEQGHDNFDNLLRSAQRFYKLKEETEDKKAFQLFLEFLSLVHRNPPAETKVLLVKYKAIIQTLHDRHKAPPIGLYEILIWMEHMITNESMVDLYKKKKEQEVKQKSEL